MILGVGLDVVEVARFARALARTPGLADRLFTPGEQADRGPESLAARFAAKEAVAKAVGAPGGLHWHDVEVRTGVAGRPTLTVGGTVAAAVPAATGWHLSLSHDAGIAAAVVVVES